MDAFSQWGKVYVYHFAVHELEHVAHPRRKWTHGIFHRIFNGQWVVLLILGSELRLVYALEYLQSAVAAVERGTGISEKDLVVSSSPLEDCHCDFV